jgi:hypothetical protein
MAIDPGLAGDTCIFIEAVPHDGGAHSQQNVWWLSPDITLVGPVSGPDTADAGQVNPVNVRFHRKPATSNCHFAGDESVSVQLWVANPSLMMSPHVRGSVGLAGFIGSPMPPEGGSHTQQVDWTPTGVAGEDPLGAGQKCLVARCFSDSGSPGTNFFLPEDQHVAQHNLCVARVTGHGLVFKFNTVNPLPFIDPPPLTAEVKLRAVLDLAPDHFVSPTVLRWLNVVPGFQQLRKTALTGGFKFDLAHLPVSHVTDHSHQGLIGFPNAGPPSFEAQVELPVRSVVHLSFSADFSNVSPGEACIFHLIQTSTGNVAEGGLTLLALKV